MTITHSLRWSLLLLTAMRCLLPVLGCAGDGDDDVAIARATGSSTQIYQNRGSTRFSVASAELKGTGSRNCYTETAFTGVTPRLKCYESGLSDTNVVSMVDYNGDGLLDLYVGNEVMSFSGNMGFGGVRDELYRNNGDGTRQIPAESLTPFHPRAANCYPRLVAYFAAAPFRRHIHRGLGGDIQASGSRTYGLLHKARCLPERRRHTVGDEHPG